MTTITFVTEGPTLDSMGLSPVTHVVTMPNEGDGQRLLAWASHPKVYGYPVTETDPDTGEETERDPTVQEIIGRVFIGFVNGTLANMVRHEQELARQQLAAPDQPVIEMT
ncbi:MAG TPA: hypothetical protein VIG24_02135 [Acidimicrobiia bacterium]